MVINSGGRALGKKEVCRSSTKKRMRDRRGKKEELPSIRDSKMGRGPR